MSTSRKRREKKLELDKQRLETTSQSLTREQIGEFLGQKVKFQGSFSKYGTRIKEFDRDHIALTLLFTDVTINGIYIDHIWVKDAKQLRNHNLREGSVVSFDCEIELYWKGFGVVRTRNVAVLRKGNGKSFLEFISYVHSTNRPLLPLYEKYLID